MEAQNSGAIIYLCIFAIALNSAPFEFAPIQLGGVASHMTEKRSTDIWNRAPRLDEAWRKFASEAEREALDNWPDGREVARRSPEQSDGRWAVAGLLIGALSEFAKAYVDRNTLVFQLRADLARRITQGEFELLGFRTSPARSRYPICVPHPDLAEYPPDWTRGIVEIRGETYAELRVAPAIWRQTGIKRGRPGSADRILAAIDKLRTEASSDFCDIDRKVASERVRKLLRSEGVDISKKGIGLTNKNIEKLIVQRCGKRRISN